jgi:hypothetical protein
MKKFVIGVVMAALIIGVGYLFFNNQTKEVERVAENTVTEQKEEVAKEPGQKEDYSAESEDKATKEFAEIKKELEKEGVDVELALKQIEENSHKVVVPKLSIDGGLERDENGKIVPSEGSGIVQSEDIDKVTKALEDKKFDAEKVSKKIADGESVDSSDKKIVFGESEKQSTDDSSEHKKTTSGEVEVKAEDSKTTDSKDSSNADIDRDENTSKEDTSTSSSTKKSDTDKERERIKEVLKKKREERAKENNKYVPEEKEFVPSEEGSSSSAEWDKMIEELPEYEGEYQGTPSTDYGNGTGMGTGDKF